MTQKTDSEKARPAALWKRLLAIVYDALILFALSFLYGTVVTFVSTSVFGNTPETYQPNIHGPLVLLGWIVTIVGFYSFFWIRVGQTVAMKAWKIKLVTISGDKLTLANCIVRCATGAFSFGCCGLGYLWVLIDRDNLALHDRISGTQVIQLSKDEA